MMTMMVIMMTSMLMTLTTVTDDDFSSHLQVIVFQRCILHCSLFTSVTSCRPDVSSEVDDVCYADDSSTFALVYDAVVLTTYVVTTD